MDNISNIVAIVGALVILYKALMTTPGEAKTTVAKIMESYEASLALATERAEKLGIKVSELEKKIEELELAVEKRDARIHELEVKVNHLTKVEALNGKSSTIEIGKEQ